MDLQELKAGPSSPFSPASYQFTNISSSEGKMCCQEFATKMYQRNISMIEKCYLPLSCSSRILGFLRQSCSSSVKSQCFASLGCHLGCSLSKLDMGMCIRCFLYCCSSMLSSSGPSSTICVLRPVCTKSWNRCLFIVMTAYFLMSSILPSSSLGSVGPSLVVLLRHLLIS